MSFYISNWRLKSKETNIECTMKTSTISPSNHKVGLLLLDKAQHLGSEEMQIITSIKNKNKELRVFIACDNAWEGNECMRLDFLYLSYEINVCTNL